MKKHILRIYVGCALNGAPPKFRKKVEKFKARIARRHPEWKILKFLGLGKAEKGSVYRHDIDCVKSCDLMVAICDHISTGLGIEIGVAVEGEIKKPVLFVTHRDWKGTRMVTDIPFHYPHRAAFQQYDGLNDVEQFIITALDKLCPMGRRPRKVLKPGESGYVEDLNSGELKFIIGPYPSFLSA